MKNVVFIIDTLNRTGGLERFVQSTCELLAPHYKTHVVKFDGKNTKIAFPLPTTTTIHELPYFKKNRYLSKFPKGPVLSYLINKKLCNLKEEAVIIPVGTRVLEFSLKYLADLYKLIACEHRNSESVLKTHESKNIRALSRKAACWMALTEFDLKNYSKIHETVFHVPNFTPTIFLIEKKNIDKKSLQLVSMGHVVPNKGFHRVLEHLIKLDERLKDHDVSYHIYGDITRKRSYFEKLKKDANNLKNIKVHFYGFQSNLAQIFNSHHIYIMSSFEEAFGLVLVEAKAYGLPCITLDARLSSGPREIIKHKQDGFIAKNNDDFFKALIFLKDKKNYEKFSKNSILDHKARFSESKALENWLKMLNFIFKSS